MRGKLRRRVSHRLGAQHGKPGEYDASQGGVARFWRVYTVTSGNEPIGVNRVVAGDFSLTDWVPSYTQVNGQLPREDIVAAVGHQPIWATAHAVVESHDASMVAP